ncbi:MAG: helix-turn-helix transcriptional regulator [Phycisphaerae bacterium]
MTATTLPPPEPLPLAVAAADAARLCGVSPAHWAAMLAGGRVPPGVRLGRRRLWPVAELRDWLAAGAPSADRWAAMQK